MAGKLTEEQRQEIVKRYEGGESTVELGSVYGCSARWIGLVLQSMGVERRSGSEASQLCRPPGLTDDEKDDIVRRYQSGEPLNALATAFRRNHGTIRSVIEESGKSTRSRRDISIARYDALLERPTEAVLRSLYLGKAQMSAPEIALRYGVTASSVYRWLDRYSIPRRSASARMRVRIKKGWRPPPLPEDARRGIWTSDDNPSTRGQSPCQRYSKREFKKLVAKIAAAKLQKYGRQQVATHCGWCASPLLIYTSRFQRANRCYCDHSCNASARNHVRWHPDEPRPLILERLRELVEERRKAIKSTPPFGDLAVTYDFLENLGEPIGAGFEEYWEIMQEWST